MDDAAPLIASAEPLRVTTTSHAETARPGGAKLSPPSDDNLARHLCALSGRKVLVNRETPEQTVVELAGHQSGLVSREQLVAAGFGEARLRTAVRRGWLSRVVRSVYRVGPEGRHPHTAEAVALLTAGPDARLVGVSVLQVLGLIRSDPARSVHLTSATGRRIPSRVPFTFHALADRAPQDFTVRERLPVTTVERALLDAADLLTDREIERAFDEALAPHRRLTSRTKMRELLARTRPNRPGHRLLSHLADPARRNTRTESELAEAALMLIRAAGLPDPVTEESLFGFRADKYWPEAGVVLEVDHYRYHGESRSGFNRDRRKDRIYAQHGLHVVRWSDEDIDRRGVECAGQLGMTLGRRIAERAAARAAERADTRAAGPAAATPGG